MSVLYLHEISSILLQLHMCNGQTAWKHGRNSRWNMFYHNEKGDFHLFHLLSIFYFYTPNSVNSVYIIAENPRLYK